HLACQPRERVVALECHSICKLIFTPRPSRCAYDAAAEQPESLAEDPETLSISCEVTFRHGTLRFNGNVSEKLLTLLIQELKR
ncbi:hypothetical protein NEO52_25560, partial [Escherichia coli]|nr:hypothetical protein [Escherichia coli]